MNSNIPVLIVVVFSTIVLLFGVAGVITPKGLRQLADKITKTRRGLNSIATFRLIFGACLLLIAPRILYPTTFQILGIIALGAALFTFAPPQASHHH